MIEQKNKKLIILAIIGTIILSIIIYFYFAKKQENEGYLEFEQNEEVILQNEIEEQKIIEKPKIIVDISGQVINPGVITLEEGSRLIDAVNLAGGTTKEADLSKVNLAYILEDAQKIYIPSIKEKEISTYIFEGSSNLENKNLTKKEEKLMVNINIATEEELQKLQGIGNSTAIKIINYRKENGKFNSIEEIKNVKGIGESKFNKIKDNICVK